MRSNIDILIVTESKLDGSFPPSQFYIDGYAPPFRLDRNNMGGGVIIYVREDIPSIELSHHLFFHNFEGIFFEIRLRKVKWLIFGGYNPNKNNIQRFLEKLGSNLDCFMSKYENFLLLGDFNSELSEKAMNDFCEIYSLKSLIKDPTCFKSINNPSTIDLILTNNQRHFTNSTIIETGLSDHHKLTVTVLKLIFKSNLH